MGVSSSHVTLLLLLPGFALHPPDYARLVRRLRVPCHVVDLWPRDLDALRALGKPGTPVFEAWIDERVAHCRSVMRGHECVVLAHSAGAEVGRRLGERRLVTFGSKEDSRAALCLRGTHDTLVPPSSPKGRAIASSHYGCVPLEAAARCAGVQMALTQRGVWLEPHVDGVDALAAALHAWLVEEEG